MEWLDIFLIHLYRLTGYPLADYFLGTLLLSFLTVIVGEWTISIVFRVNRRHLAALDDRVDTMNRLSAQALGQGDEKSYQAINKEGNEAFGQLFFNKFGLSAAALWPICFALAWMQTRFADISLPLPFFGFGINYVAIFILCFIIARILFNRIKSKLPYFGSIHQRLVSGYE
jgi:hypothetical protein